ncbi:MAG: hypothetical protein MPN21_27450 [Thermoanaerobaculia bacterium]|nr:hypothetical protein [Thermoanaerobaculia bacterium]
MKLQLSRCFVLLGALFLSAPLSSQEALSHGDSDPCPLVDSKKNDVAPTEMPFEVGQDAFLALAEMRSILESDPTIDWAHVDLNAFREHLVDMHRVVLDARVRERHIEGGFEAETTGEGRTLEAIRRMVPAHVRFAGRQNGLDASVRALRAGDHQDDGLVVRVTTNDLSHVAKLQGLGFFGFLTSGEHHRPHHLAMTKGAGHP